SQREALGSPLHAADVHNRNRATVPPQHLKHNRLSLDVVVCLTITGMSAAMITIKRVAQNIRYKRRQNVINVFELAALYAITTTALNQAVKRNATHFPVDFMFQITSEKTRSLRSQFVTTNRQVVKREVPATNWSQFVTSSSKHRGATYQPYAFTE